VKKGCAHQKEWKKSSGTRAITTDQIEKKKDRMLRGVVAGRERSGSKGERVGDCGAGFL